VFRRLFWLITGASFGFGLSFWLTRFLRETVERYSPERVSGNVAGALKAFGADVRAAANEGRMAMRETEEQLRAEADTRTRPLV
jgi:hypothetical protein